MMERCTSMSMFMTKSITIIPISAATATKCHIPLALW
jgi:hypothetical protein